MTQEEAGKLPDYVAASAPDAARDDERLNVSLFAPTGGNITDLTVEAPSLVLAPLRGMEFSIRAPLTCMLARRRRSRIR